MQISGGFTILGGDQPGGMVMYMPPAPLITSSVEYLLVVRAVAVAITVAVAVVLARIEHRLDLQ